MLAVQPALARNFHISGGIQYVHQATLERAKPSPSEADARRMFGKGIAQLNEGLKEDPDDLEAWDYLGIAYAEIDSAEQAGWAFSQGIGAARGKEERKKLLDRLIVNRDHYWTLYFNEAIRQYQKCLDAAGEGKPPDSTCAMGSATAMRRALALNPENAKTYCNLAAFQANAGRHDEAIQTVEAGLKVASTDSCLLSRKQQLAGVKIEQAATSGNLAEAIPGLEKMLADNPNDGAAALRLGELYFQQGLQLSGEADKTADAAAKKDLEAKAKTAFANSARGFGKYVELKPDDKDGRYNQALALLRAENYAEAAKVAHAGVLADPTSPDFHNVLGNAYRGLKLEEAASGHQLIAKTLREGTKQDDATAFATQSAAKWGAKSYAAQRLKELGAPDEVRTQTMGDYQVETWLWWGRKRAVVLSKGQRVIELDFANLTTSAAPKGSSPKSAPKSPSSPKTPSGGKSGSASGASR